MEEFLSHAVEATERGLRRGGSRINFSLILFNLTSLVFFCLLIKTVAYGYVYFASGKTEWEKRRRSSNVNSEEVDRATKNVFGHGNSNFKI